jgi:hypothetical protein
MSVIKFPAKKTEGKKKPLPNGSSSCPTLPEGINTK